MGGVTDGPTVIRGLKSIFSGNAEGKGKSSVFVLFTTFTPVVLLILAGLIFWQRMSNEHINCYAPPEEDIRAAAVNQYCFVTGTYTIKGYPEELTSLKRALPYIGIGRHIPASKLNGGGTAVKYHFYFQWVPFVMLAQAILFTIPNFIRKSLRKDSLSRYCNSIEAEDLTDTKKITHSSKRFLRNLQNHSSFSTCFIISELSNLVAVILAFILTDFLLAGDFSYLGRHWITYMRTDSQGESETTENLLSTNPLDEIFPKMSKCEFKKYGPGGGIIKHDLLCVMTLNVFHDKVFLILWFWFVFLVIIQVLNLLYQLGIFCVKDYQCRLILKRLEPAFLEGDGSAESFDIDPSFKRNAKEFLCALGFSDWFLLEAISSSVDTEKFCHFFQALVNQHEEKTHYNRENNRRRENEYYFENSRYAHQRDFYGDQTLRGKGQNEGKNSRHFPRNRSLNYGDSTPRPTMYTHLNESLREMREEAELDERKSLLELEQPRNSKLFALGGGSTMKPQQPGQQQSAVLLKPVVNPDGVNKGHEYSNITTVENSNDKARDDIHES